MKRSTVAGESASSELEWLYESYSLHLWRTCPRLNFYNCVVDEGVDPFRSSRTYDPSSPVGAHVAVNLQRLALVSSQVHGVNSGRGVPVEQGLGAVPGVPVQNSSYKHTTARLETLFMCGDPSSG